MENNKVIDVDPIKAPVAEPVNLIYRFVGNHLSLTVNQLAYVLNIIGVNVPEEVYERMPDEVKKHFMLVKV